jgi:lambda repressor-like predicted transcriptional regulator
MAKPLLLTLPDGRQVTRRALARELGVQPNTLDVWLKKYPLAEVLTRQARGTPPTLYTLPDGRQISETALAKELGVNRMTLRSWLRRHTLAEVLTRRPRAYRGQRRVTHETSRRTATYPGPLSPEHALIRALFQVAVSDARSKATYAHKSAQTIAEARAWLRDREAVTWWIDLANLPEATYEALLAEAGLPCEDEQRQTG